MKLIYFFLISLWCLIAYSPSPGLAQVQEKHFYLSGNLGLGSGFKADDGQGVPFDFGPGFLVSGGVGYRFNPYMRVEVSLAHRRKNVKEPEEPDCTIFFLCFTSATPVPPDDGEITANSAMLNIYFDLRAEEFQTFYPFVGFGLGAAIVSADLERGGVPVVDDEATVLAYQITVGLGWDPQPNAVITGGFRFFGTQDPGFKNLSGQDVNIDFKRGEFILGVMVFF